MNSAATRVERTALLHFNLGIEEGEEKSARYSKESFRPSTISRQQNSLESYFFRIFLWRNTKQEALLSGHRNRISIESMPEISKSLAGSRYNFCSRIFILHDNLLIHPFKLPTPFFLASWKETILPYTLSYPLTPSLTPLHPLSPPYISSSSTRREWENDLNWSIARIQLSVNDTFSSLILGYVGKPCLESAFLL